MKRLIIFFLFIILILLLFVGFFWFYEVHYLVGRAEVSRRSFSVDNSYLFVSPLRAKAGSKSANLSEREKIRVTVIVLNNQGLGVMGKRVSLGKNPSLQIETVQGLTDNFGKAVFDVSSEKKGEYYLEVKVEDKILPQKAHLSFY